MSRKQERETGRGSVVEACEDGPFQDLSPRAREVVAELLDPDPATRRDPPPDDLLNSHG